MSGQILTQRGMALGRQVASGRLRRVTPPAPVSEVTDDMVFIEEQAVGGGGAASVTFSSISGSYRHLFIYWIARSTTTVSKFLRIQFNGDSGSNYSRIGTQGFDTSTITSEENGVASGCLGTFTASDGLADAVGSGEIIIPYYSSSTFFKNAHGINGRVDSTGTTTAENWRSTWQSASAITQVVLFPDSGNFAEGSSFSLYGLT